MFLIVTSWMITCINGILKTMRLNHVIRCIDSLE
jgi:hypothetical protein